MTRLFDLMYVNSDHPEIHVACIQREDQFCDLKADWNRLASLADDANIFLRFEWHDAAWQWARLTGELYILCVQQGGMMIGICPFVRRRRHYGGIAIRSIEFLDVPDSQTCDILAAHDQRSDVIQALVRYLRQNSRTWDTVILDKLHAGSPTRDILQTEMLGAGFRAMARESTSDFGMSLEGKWDAYYSRRTRRLKKGNNLVANHLRQKYRKIEIDWLNGSSVDEKSVADGLAKAIAISSHSWKKTTHLTLDNPGPNAFIRRLTQHAHRHGWLSLWMLRLDDVTVAMEYQISYQGHVHALRADFDQSHHEQSPGTYLSWKLLEKLFDADQNYYHMGPGENAYKRRWAEDIAVLYELSGFSTTLRGRALGLWRVKLRPFGKRLLARLSRGRWQRGVGGDTSRDAKTTAPSGDAD